MSRLISKAEVIERTGLSYTTIWRWMRADQFPRGVVLAPRVVRWHESEIEEWVASRERQRLKGDPEPEDETKPGGTCE